MAFSRKCIYHNCFRNVAASRSLAKQSPVRLTKLTLRRVLQRHQPPLRNDMAILSSILEKTMRYCPRLADATPKQSLPLRLFRHIPLHGNPLSHFQRGREKQILAPEAG